MPKSYIKTSACKALCKENGRRVSADFISALNGHVLRKLEAACKAHNGGKVTLDAAIAGFVGILPKV